MDIGIVPMKTAAEKTGKAYVHYQAWNEAYTGLIDQKHLDNRSVEKCMEKAFDHPENTLVAKDGDKVVGFVCYGESRDGDLPDAGEVYALYVLRAYQGQKVGYRLMNAAVEQLDGKNKVALWVLKNNLSAQRFYERYGFRADGTEAQIYLGTEIRMVLLR